MITQIMLEGQQYQNAGIVDVNINRQIAIKMPAEQARQVVNTFVHMDISTQMHAETPLLVISNNERSVWRVPVHLTFPDLGDVGCVGYIHINTITGEADTSKDIVNTIRQNAADLAKRFTSPPAFAG